MDTRYQIPDLPGRARAKGNPCSRILGGGARLDQRSLPLSLESGLLFLAVAGPTWEKYSSNWKQLASGFPIAGNSFRSSASMSFMLCPFVGWPLGQGPLPLPSLFLACASEVLGYELAKRLTCTRPSQGLPGMDTILIPAPVRVPIWIYIWICIVR